MHKYPRTKHLEGSRLQPGDQDLDQVPIEALSDRYLVVEEKIDGANAAISFGGNGDLHLQSRGHYLTGGRRERHFALLKTWAACHRNALWEILGNRYVLYGEWAYAKHTIYYDQLPHYFLEFDILDTERDVFLDTDRRHAMLYNSPVVSVPVLHRGLAQALPPPAEMVTRSLYKGESWRKRLVDEVQAQGLDVERVWREADPSDDAEGVYIKAEANGQIVGRFKWIRSSFLTAVVDSGTHWLNRPIIPNALCRAADIFRS